MKKPRNLLPKNLKWAFLTLLLSTIGTGKLSAQTQEDSLLKSEIRKAVWDNLNNSDSSSFQIGPQKTVLSRQDSLSVYQICLPESYKNISELIDNQEVLSNLLKTYVYSIDSIKQKCNGTYTSADIAEMEKLTALSDEIMKQIDKVNSYISKELKYYFTYYIEDPKGLTVYPVEGKPNTSIIDITTITIDGESFIVSPGDAFAKESRYICRGE